MEREKTLGRAEDLVAWYRENARQLPWREGRNPWFVWVSEVMLQQTQVTTVIPRFEEFVRRFPTVESLAKATEEEVLAAWSGLGYYQRARRLLEGARQVVAAGGEVPRSVPDLRAISGVGEYTAAAIASISYGVPEPVVDGNVERVLTRLLTLDGDPKRAAMRRTLRGAAREFLLPGLAGDCNQALMELGATVCTPRRPRCVECPLEAGCRAHLGGVAENYPQPRRRRPTETRGLIAAVVTSGAKVLLARRGDEEKVLAGTWELPWAAMESGMGLRCLESLLGDRYGGRWKLVKPLVKVRHAITFRRLEVQAFAASVEALEATVAGGSVGRATGWFDSKERSLLPLSSLVEKVLSQASGLALQELGPEELCPEEAGP